MSFNLFGSALVPSSSCTRVHLENQKPPPPPKVSVLSFFGQTLGGVAALEHDNSPVTVGAIVSKRGGMLGQSGSSLQASTAEAERTCQEIWKVSAEVAGAAFREGNPASPSRSSTLDVTSAPDPTKTEQDDSTDRGSRFLGKYTRKIDATIEEAVRRGKLDRHHVNGSTRAWNHNAD